MLQMQRRAKEFVPSMLPDIGFYSGKAKDLSHDITFTMSESFIQLVEAGRVNSSTHHLIVSDEGHNEISVRRVQEYKRAFTPETALVSATATGAYNTMKSIALTHGSYGFERDMIECIENGELVPSYRTQLQLIRVAPPTLKQEQQAAAKGILRLEYEMRKQAWIDYAIEYYAQGIDDQTGDPLRENHGGFYGADTDHADRISDALNQHPLLIAQAKSMGLKGVSRAIHHKSGSPKEIRAQLEDVLDGAYLIATMDKMGREGFDWPAMKNVSDWNHYSSLQKKQIMGRPARKFRNPRKEFRLEGTTFLDYITYIGSQDPVRDKQLRDRALMRSMRKNKI